MTERLASDLALAHAMADAADVITMARWRHRALTVDIKADNSPVSDADRAVERALRDMLATSRPTDAVLGEEEGGAPAGGRRWILDPIDGTRAFVRGLPVFATLIALEEDGVVVAGVVSAPALHRRWWAGRGLGAHADTGPISVSAVTRVEDAFISATDPRYFTAPGLRHAYAALARRCWTARMLGDFWSHVLVAEGVVDIAVEVGAEIYDWAPLQVIVEEAGCRFTDLDGTERCDGAAAIATNGHLHQEVLGALRG